MKKKYTDSDIQKMLVDLAEFVPEIDPNDAEWREFLREFIVARPNVQLNKEFAKEIRERILARSQQLKKSCWNIPQWLKLSGTFVAGAAMCATVIIPILRTPEFFETQDFVHENKTNRLKTIDAKDEKHEVIELILEDNQDISEFNIAPMMAKEMSAPVMVRSMPTLESDEMMVAAGTLNSTIGEVSMGSEMIEPMMFDGAINSRKRKMPPQLKWEEMPSDSDILRVATVFFMKHNFDTLSVSEPRLDKWWDNEETSWKPEFAPDRVGVIFSGENGLEDIRIDVETQTLKVVWMSYNHSAR
jgi:hypothetical protein